MYIPVLNCNYLSIVCKIDALQAHDWNCSHLSDIYAHLPIDLLILWKFISQKTCINNHSLILYHTLKWCVKQHGKHFQTFKELLIKMKGRKFIVKKYLKSICHIEDYINPTHKHTIPLIALYAIQYNSIKNKMRRRTKNRNHLMKIQCTCAKEAHLPFDHSKPSLIWSYNEKKLELSKINIKRNTVVYSVKVKSIYI